MFFCAWQGVDAQYPIERAETHCAGNERDQSNQRPWAVLEDKQHGYADTDKHPDDTVIHSFVRFHDECFDEPKIDEGSAQAFDGRQRKK